MNISACSITTRKVIQNWKELISEISDLTKGYQVFFLIDEIPAIDALFKDPGTMPAGTQIKINLGQSTHPKIDLAQSL